MAHRRANQEEASSERHCGEPAGGSTTHSDISNLYNGSNYNGVLQRMLCDCVLFFSINAYEHPDTQYSD
jgi:hypothetical protein